MVVELLVGESTTSDCTLRPNPWRRSRRRRRRRRRRRDEK